MWSLLGHAATATATANYKDRSQYNQELKQLPFKHYFPLDFISTQGLRSSEGHETIKGGKCRMLLQVDEPHDGKLQDDKAIRQQLAVLLGGGFTWRSKLLATPALNYD